MIGWREDYAVELLGQTRGRGYARAVVAGALLAARTRGVERSVLFTGVENHAAQATYRALGYDRVGDYGLVRFAEPRPIARRE